MRFFYFYPSYSSPSGGNKQLRLQGQLLAELGHEVFLVRDQKYFDQPEEYDDDRLYNIPAEIWSKPIRNALSDFQADDILVLPEGKLDSVLPECVSTRARIVINNQNGFYALRYFPSNRALCRRIHAVISNSPYNCTVSRIAYAMPASRVFYVPHWVLRGNFMISQQDEIRKQVGICYMPRKLPEIVSRVKSAVQTRFPEVPWIEIDRVPEVIVSERLRRYTMFFAAQHLEGCPLTALEAMACGCIVAGFPGTESFTHPYANSDNGYWAKDNDVHAATNCVINMIVESRFHPQRMQQLQENGLKTAQGYSRSAVTVALEKLVTGLTSGSVPSANSYTKENRSRSYSPEERWICLDYLYALRKMYHYGRLNGIAGRSAKILERILRWGRPQQ